MCGSCRQILLKAGQVALVALNLLREIFQQPVFQTILLALMVSLHQAKTCHIHVQIHLFLDGRITGAQGFDFRVRQRRFINVIAGAHRALARHDL